MVVFFLIDAMRPDYINIENTPFLNSCREAGETYQKVIPSSGFCERNEIFTGETPKDSNYFLAIGFDPDNSFYKGKAWLPFLAFFENLFEKIRLKIKGRSISVWFRKVALRLFRPFLRQDSLKPYNIPFFLLSDLRLTEDYYSHFEGDHVKEHSLFTRLKTAGKSFNCDSFTALNMPSNGNDQDRLLRAREVCKNGNADFLPIYISVLDSIGHRFGPKSSEMESALRDLDSTLKEFAESVLSENPDCKFFFLGDHGMTEVSDVFDIVSHTKVTLKGHGFRYRKDYTLFADSTILRFWCPPEKREKIKEILRNDPKLNSKGKMINDDDRKKYFLPRGGRLYGDLAWWANEGVLIFPDFFHTEVPYKGMHGYKTDVESTYGTCIVWGNKVLKQKNDEISLHQVYDLLNKHLLEI